ncbi:MAG: hypothetical protein ACK5PZ_06455 [Pirellula sp.]
MSAYANAAQSVSAGGTRTDVNKIRQYHFANVEFAWLVMSEFGFADFKRPMIQATDDLSD